IISTKLNKNLKQLNLICRKLNKNGKPLKLNSSKPNKNGNKQQRRSQQWKVVNSGFSDGFGLSSKRKWV
ncbi:MAG: hypothetical protein ACFBSE_14555, partial [Prochloraceae cyanobacterium]